MPGDSSWQTSSTGFLCKVITPGKQETDVMPMPTEYSELTASLAEMFELQRPSVTLKAKHLTSSVWVAIGIQEDLDAALAEASENGMHTVTLQVSGTSSKRNYDVFAFLVSLAETSAQIGWAYHLTTEVEVFSYTVTMVSLMLFVTIINYFVTFYILDGEYAENRDFKIWMRPAHTKLLVNLFSPFTMDILPLLASKACCFTAPLRVVTRDWLIQWSIVVSAIQGGTTLYLMNKVHLIGEVELTTLPQACLAATVLSLVVNMPRRLVHFLVGSCEASYKLKAELAEEAAIDLKASEKLAKPEKQPEPLPQKTPPKGSKGASPPQRPAAPGNKPVPPRPASRAPGTKPTKPPANGYVTPQAKSKQMM